MRARWPVRICSIWVSLKFATTHTSLTGTISSKAVPGATEPADADLAVADDAVDRCMHHGVVEIDLGEIACGLCLRHGSNGGFALTGKDGDALPLGLYCCRRRRHARLGSRQRRIAFIDLGLADGVGSGSARGGDRRPCEPNSSRPRSQVFELRPAVLGHAGAGSPRRHW